MNNRLALHLSAVAAASILFLAACNGAPPVAAGPSAINDAALPPGVARNILLTDAWKFSRGDDAGARLPDFNDAAWRTLDLPHDWGVEGPFDPKLASCTAFLPAGIAWYRKTFSLPPDAQGKSITLRFDGISNHSTVWCNGQQVGGRPYGYSSFTCDLTPAVHLGAGNVIAVRVDHEKYADSRWYNGSGIYRNVFLNITDKVHIDDTAGAFVTTPNVSPNATDVNIQTAVKNETAAPAEVTVITSIKNPRGAVVASATETGSIPPGARQQFTANEKIARPDLWSPHHPAMYAVETRVKQNGRTLDDDVTPFGIRTFLFDPNKGFSLNGESMKLKGVCLHGDAGALGVAVPIQIWQRRLKLLQDAGCNAIRCSHNPPAPEFLDLCDRMGFLVMDEAFDEWTGGKKKWIVGHNVGKPGTDGYHSDFDQWADTDIRDMVLRDRNHPSIIMWSIGNEIDYQNDPFPPNSPLLPPIAARLIADVKAVDASRPVTAACAFPATNLFKKLLDIQGYNYMERLYAGDHAANPDRIIYGSENSQSLPAWQAVEQHDYIAGQFLWTGADYLGEAGVWPTHASPAGLLNLAGFPKNQYYFRKSLWTDAPMVYLSTTALAPARRRGARADAAPTISCFTNCDRVELFHDGQSLGTKSHTPGEILTWPLDFTTGALRAVGTKGAATTAVDLKKAGNPAQLLLHPDVAALRADGRDVAQIELDVADIDGTRVPDASNRITCRLSGPGRILGIENGDIRDTESYVAPSHSAYEGRMMIYVESLKSAGNLTLTVSTPALRSASATWPIQ